MLWPVILKERLYATPCPVSGFSILVSSLAAPASARIVSLLCEAPFTPLLFFFSTSTDEKSIELLAMVLGLFLAGLLFPLLGANGRGRKNLSSYTSVGVAVSEGKRAGQWASERVSECAGQ